MIIPTRYFAILIALFASLFGVIAAQLHPAWWTLAVPSLALSAVGTIDMVQTRSTIRRNYPILARLRYWLESIRPEIRQYFLEGDREEIPFSRQQRSLVYQRAKSALDQRPFGTQLNAYQAGYEWLSHTMTPTAIDDRNFRVTVGEVRAQPYDVSVLNISAMSFGALSANAIESLNKGAASRGFYHDTGEGGVSRYHRLHGGDLVWEIGTGYFGCRADNGHFDPERFAETATDDQIRMIEIKLSQGAKPAQGGVLPGEKVTAEIAAARGIPMGETCRSPAGHSAFSTPVELLAFITRLRRLSGDKPVGFKLAVGHPWEWLAIAKAMRETDIVPDFIVVDGAEGGTGAAPLEFSDHVGTPLVEGLSLVHNTLVGLRLRDRVKIGAAGKVISGFDIARLCALGADWANAARGFMFALGCIQAQSCHTNRCPTGVATQDPLRQRMLHVPDKATRVANFHRGTVDSLAALLEAAGLTHPGQLGPQHIVRRVSSTDVRAYAGLFPQVAPGALETDGPYGHGLLDLYWKQVTGDSFDGPDGLSERQRAFAQQPDGRLTRRHASESPAALIAAS